MRDSFEEWRKTDLISWIDFQAMRYNENYIFANAVYMSLDVYADLIKQWSTIRRYVGGVDTPYEDLKSIKINTTAGPLTVHKLDYLTNFCHVGTQTSFARLEMIRAGQELEDIIWNK